MKTNFIIILIGIAFVGLKSNAQIYRPALIKIISELDSLTIIDTTLRIDNGKSFKVFLEYSKTATTREIKYLIKTHQNAVIRGYSYMALKIREEPKSDELIKENFLNLMVCKYDVCRRFSKTGDKKKFNSDDFITYLKPSIGRIKNIIKVYDKNYILDEEEEKAIEEENKIREEQGIPQVKTNPK